ncbi:hypothetical protein HMPREF9419_0136 [Prevotella nigrescens ATCC 33563]|nr:hypothetical protein HMPREF9419_0136 [Prevotella nigrescens ATCC 33563]
MLDVKNEQTKYFFTVQIFAFLVLAMQLLFLSTKQDAKTYI